MSQSEMMPVYSIFHFPRPSRLANLIRSRIRPPDIELDTVRNILARYKLDLIGNPSNLPLSRRTRNVILNTSAGRLVLKRYRSILSKEGVIYCHSVIMRLKDLKFPAIRLNFTPEGENFVSLNGCNYALFDYIQGINYSLRFLFPSDQFRLTSIAGQTLARFHSELQEFNPDGQHHWGFVSRFSGWQRDISWLEKKVEELMEKTAGIQSEKERCDANWLAKNSNTILDGLNQLDNRLRPVLPRLIVHGDFGLHNLIFQKYGQPVLTDFESVRLEWRLGDLVTTLSRFSASDGSYKSDLSKSFMLGYQSVFPVSKEEGEFFPDVWRFYKLRSVIINWNSYFESEEEPVKLAVARESLKQADWAMNHRSQLLEFLRM